MTKKKQKKPPGFGYPTVLEFTDKSILDYFDVLAAIYRLERRLQPETG